MVSKFKVFLNKITLGVILGGDPDFGDYLSFGDNSGWEAACLPSKFF